MPSYDSEGTSNDCSDSEGAVAKPTYTASRGVDDTKYAQIDELTRRRLLSLGGTAAVSALLAGCQSPNDDTPQSKDVVVDSTSDSNSQIIENEKGETMIQTTVRWGWTADETTMNYLSPSNFPGGYTSTFFHSPMTLFSKQTNKYYPVVLKELPTFEDCYQIHSFEKGWKWWDGMEVNARDHVWGHQVQAFGCCGGPDEVVWAAEPMDSKYKFRENKGAPYAKRYAAGNAQKGVRWKRDIWKPFVDRLRDASNQEEINKIVKEARNLDLTVANVKEHMSGNGLWKPVDWSADQITMERFEDHPWADRTDIDKWVIRVAPKKQTQLQLINSDEIDIGNTNFQQRLNNPPQNLENVVNLPGSSGVGITFNWRRKHAGDRAFRRAIAYLLPMKDLAAVSNQSGQPATAMDKQTTAAPTNIVEQLTSDEFLDKIIDYGVDTKEDKATRTLKNAGYTKKGGNWVGPNGKKVSLRFIAQNTGANANIGAAVSGLLSSFGIENNFSILESGTYQQAHSGEAGNFDYDISLTGMGIDDSYAGLMGEAGQVDLLDTNGGWKRPKPDKCVSEPIKAPRSPDPDLLTKQKDGSGFLTWFYGIPITKDGLFPEVPTQIGQKDLSGETFKPPLANWALWSRYRYSEKQLQEWADKFLWWCNFHMPRVYLFQHQASLWMDTENFQLREGGKFWSAATDKYPHTFGDLVSK